jgi:hypothetical protein
LAELYPQFNSLAKTYLFNSVVRNCLGCQLIEVKRELSPFNYLEKLIRISMFEELPVSHSRDAATVSGNVASVVRDPYSLDFNVDGRPDVIWHDPVSGRNVLWLMDGAQGNQYRASVELDATSGAWHVKSTADFNQDGQLDLVMRNEATGENELWFMGGENGSQRLSRDPLTGLEKEWDIRGTADFNQDGRADIIWRNAKTGENSVWLMGGDKGREVISRESLKSVAGAWNIEGVADFNKDNRADIVWRHGVTGDNVVWFMGGNKGTEFQSQDRIKAVATHWSLNGVSDFNRDGNPDLLWRHQETGRNVVWQMGGANNTQPSEATVELPNVKGTWKPLVNGWKPSTLLPPAPVLPAPPSSPATETKPNQNGFNIEFDYRFDTNNWFDAQKRAVLEEAANIWESIIQDDFKNIPAGQLLHASDPSTGGLREVRLDREIDDVLVFAFAQNFGATSNRLAEAGATSYPGDRNTTSVFQPWLGELVLNSGESWYVNADSKNSVTVPGSQVDMLSVAIHELGHVLGISSSLPAFKALINSKGEFTGQAAMAMNGGKPIPLDARGSHIHDGFELEGLGENALDPNLAKGERKLLTSLDVALLDDIGYSVNYSSLKPVPTVKVLSTMEGNREVGDLQVGGSYKLRWTDNFSDNVKIDLYEGTRFVRTIAASVPSNGSYDWQAPAELADGKYYRIKVTSTASDKVFSFGDRPFTIKSRLFINANTPNGGNALRVGSEYDLSWNDNINETVKIELLRNGQIQRILTGSTASDGSYLWRIPTQVTSGSDYQIRFTSTNNSSLVSETGRFSIVA